MKAIQVSEPGKINIIEKKRPVITEANEVMIQVQLVGVCGSDLHIYHGSNPLATYPRIIGHEITGTIAELGKSVTHLSIGDKVVIEPLQACGECYACKQGRKNVCLNIQVYGVHLDGGMQEYLVIPEKNVHKVDADTDLKDAVLIEPLTIGAQANWRGDVKENDTVLIMGAGPIGLCCLKIAKAKGAVCIVTDLNKERLKFAKSFGADYILNAAEDNIFEAVMEITKQEGANVVIDAVCIPKTFEDAVEIVSPAGRVVVMGFDTSPSSIPQLPITKKEVTIVGSRLQTEKFPVIIELLDKKKLNLEGMVTHYYSYKDIHEALALIENNPEDVRKLVLSFTS